MEPNKIALFLGMALVVFGVGVWFFRRETNPGDTIGGPGGLKFELHEPGLIVAALGIILMLASPKLAVVDPGPPDPFPKPTKVPPGPAVPVDAAPPSGTVYFVQLSSEASGGNSDHFRHNITTKLTACSALTPSIVRSDDYTGLASGYNVAVLGPYNSKSEADALLKIVYHCIKNSTDNPLVRTVQKK